MKLGFRFLFLSCTCLLPFCLAAQDKKDSLLLDEVYVRAVRDKKFNSGYKEQDIDSLRKAVQQARTLDELLMGSAPLYFKAYGNGMLSTVSFRGTSSNHTAVFWNGININMPSLGQTDFSTVPVFLMDQVAVHYGSSSALFGTDAIGGAVHLDHEPRWNNGTSVSLTQEYGSFNTWFSGIKGRFSQGNVDAQVKVFRFSSDNNFPFVNITRSGNPIERQVNANVLRYGASGDLNIKFSDNTVLLISSMFSESDRQVQPTMTVRNSNDEKDDISARLVANLFHYGNKSSYNFKIGNVKDVLIYNGSSSEMSRMVSGFSYEYNLKNYFYIKAGTDLNIIKAYNESYGGEVSENRADVYTSFKFHLNKFSTSFNLRKAYVTGFDPPLTPSLGLDYSLLTRKNSNLTLKAAYSYSYRVPTTNERFWQPGGNPDIKPEFGKGVDAGLNFKINKRKFNTEWEVSVYNLLVDNWVNWVQKVGYVTPENIQKVRSEGMEISQKYSGRSGVINYSFGWNYAYTRCTILKTEGNQSVLNNQLAYVPYHLLGSNASLAAKQFFINANYTYTGIRYINTSNRRSLDPFMLVNISFGKNFIMKGSSFTASAKVDNLTNKSYMNYEYMAMPGRNYSFSLLWNVNFNQ